MAATRLTDSQKSEVVARFRAGAAAQELAEAFGCSAYTVSRIVKAALEPRDYEALKQRRGGRRGGRSGDGEGTIQAELLPPSAAVTLGGIDRAGDDDDTVDGIPGLAIGDGRDFEPAIDGPVDDDDEADEQEDEYVDDDEEDFLAGEEGEGEDEFLPIPPLAISFDAASTPREPLPLASAPLPASVYMLVDKTVELQARPLSDFPELGRLSEEEQQRQALVVYANPRQAKRQCGRSQRVIKVPDARVLERTAAYLLAQGISRVVIEGALYSLPGS